MTAAATGRVLAAQPGCVYRRNLLVYRRTWRSLSAFLTPAAVPDRDGDRPQPADGARTAAACSAASTTSTSWARASWPRSCMQTASFESTYPIMGKISGAGTTRRCWPRPIEVHHLLGRRAELDRLPADDHGERLPGRAHPVRDPAQSAGAAGHPGLRCSSASPSRRRSSPSPPPEERLRLRRALPLHHQPALPVQRHLLPGLPDCPMRSSGSPPPRRCTTAWRWCAARSCDRARWPTWPLHVAYLVIFGVDLAVVAYRLLRRRLVTRWPDRWRPPRARLPARSRRRRSPRLLRSRRLVQRNMLVYRRGWMVIFSGFFEPLFYLLGIGSGSARLVGGVTLADGRTIP